MAVLSKNYQALHVVCRRFEKEPYWFWITRTKVDFGPRRRAYSTLRSSCLNYLLMSIALFQLTFKIFPGKIISSLIRSTYVYNQNQIPAKSWLVLHRTHVAPWHTDRQTDERTDDGQRDPYVSLWFVRLLRHVSPIVWDRQTHWQVVPPPPSLVGKFYQNFCFFFFFFWGGGLQPPPHFWIEWWKNSNERLHPLSNISRSAYQTYRQIDG